MNRSRDPTLRFSERVEDYVRFRPTYPRALVSVLRQEIGLRRDWVVADIGSGTGISSAPFLEHGNRVVGVEPNPAMRAAAEERFAGDPAFRSVDGRAEATRLGPESVDLVVTGQAFHWFDPGAAKAEFARILRPPRWVVLFWNTRLADADGFSRAYEALLERFGTDYESVRHDRHAEEAIESLFEGGVKRRGLPNEQHLDLEGLEGRLRSSSYLPAVGDPDHERMLEAARDVFREHSSSGTVCLRYETEIYFDRMVGPLL